MNARRLLVKDSIKKLLLFQQFVETCRFICQITGSEFTTVIKLGPGYEKIIFNFISIFETENRFVRVMGYKNITARKKETRIIWKDLK